MRLVAANEVAECVSAVFADHLFNHSGLVNGTREWVPREDFILRTTWNDDHRVAYDYFYTTHGTLVSYQHAVIAITTHFEVTYRCSYLTEQLARSLIVRSVHHHSAIIAITY